MQSDIPQDALNGATHGLPLAARRRNGLQNAFWSEAKYSMADTVGGE